MTKNVKKFEAILVDLDGTLCDNNHRVHLIPDWDAFHARCEEDVCFNHIKLIVNSISVIYKILIVTARPVKYKEPSERWLYNNGIKYDEIYMRGNKDFRQDYVSKEEILDKFILPRFNPIFVLEDNTNVTHMYRSRGIYVLQVNDGPV